MSRITNGDTAPRDGGSVEHRLARLLDTPFLARVVPHLPAEALHQLKHLGNAVEAVARQLGNTKAVCRKCYIHPVVIDAHLDGSLAEAMTGRSVEACVKRLLGRRRKPRSLVPLLKQSLRKLRRRGTTIAGAHHHAQTT